MSELCSAAFSEVEHFSGLLRYGDQLPSLHDYTAESLHELIVVGNDTAFRARAVVESDTDIRSRQQCPDDLRQPNSRNFESDRIRVIRRPAIWLLRVVRSGSPADSVEDPPLMTHCTARLEKRGQTCGSGPFFRLPAECGCGCRNLFDLRSGAAASWQGARVAGEPIPPFPPLKKK